MTIFYRALGEVSVGEEVSERAAALEPAFYDAATVSAEHRARLAAWLETWAARVRAEGRPDEARREQMRLANPRYVLRNYLAQEAIDAATAGDAGLVHRLLEVLRRPYDDQPGQEALAAKRPEWARNRPGCSQLSCSS